ncbi:MAG: serine/threonine protein kinase [Moorea sp. SIO4G2]|nr:serine/threonine protein kinase [Moorena sp. SIO4G2]
MSYCLNPTCPNPQNREGTKFCIACGSKLLLKERYRGIKPIGQGGFGKTFLAVDEDKPSKPPCVIKQFFPQAQGTNTVQKAAELFTLEAVRLDELGKHPQIPELLAYFCQDSQQYLVQEFIDGQNLVQELASGGGFNEAQIRALLDDLLPLLQFVHQHHVIHRDIKPENIIRRRSLRSSVVGGATQVPGQLVLVDFGASKAATGTSLGKTGTAIGSFGYVSPEQSIGRAVFASDIYSLGITCIHLLTNRHPCDLFDVREGVWIWRNVLSHPISDQLGRILDKMIAGAINRRYQSAAEVSKELHLKTTPATPLRQQKPVTPLRQRKPVTPIKPTVPSKPAVGGLNKRIAQELEELKSEIMGNPTPNSKHPTLGSKVAGSSSLPKTKTKLDRELEEIQSEFIGSSNPQQNPGSG